MSYTTRKIRRASERGTRLANIRWDRDRRMREAVAASELAKLDWTVVKRIVVIERETTVREIVFFACDRYADRVRKLREARALAVPETA